MATGSYLVRGRGNPESWYSCSHGSGRKLSRTEAKKIISAKDLELTMADIVWDRDHSAAIVDEGPSAYKNLEEVMTNQRGLVEIVHKFRPILNMKGWDDKKGMDGGEWTDASVQSERLRGRKAVPRRPSPAIPLATKPDPDRPPMVPLYPACEGQQAQPKSPSFQELPIWQHVSEIRSAIARSQVVCVQGETGCGKSSVLPTVLLEDPNARIACTQPRRLAAIALAQRVASLRNEKLGEQVGYRVAMDGASSSSTRLTFATAGWLLMRLAHAPGALSRYTHIVLDEIHERDMDADLLLLLLRKELPKFPQLRVILMSATVDTSRFLDYFEASGVAVEREPLIVGVRRFPTWQYFLDEVAHGGALPSAALRVRTDRLDRATIDQKRIDIEPQLLNAAVNIVSAVAKPGLCVLVFLPGLAEIEQLNDLLVSQKDSCPLTIYWLHSAVPHEQQRQALQAPPPRHAKVVLSTNIAESSVTIPDVRYVVDFGVMRRMVFDDVRGMQALTNAWCSRATCEQRRGRCGRLIEGVVIHMFPRVLYGKMPAFAEPEILSIPLESIYLRSMVLLGRIGSPELLLGQLMDPPPQARITGAAQNLRDLGAITDDQVGPLGRIAVFMPTTIQLTKLIVIGWSLEIPADAIVIAAALSVDDIFQMATPQNVSRPEEFPALLARNYTVRAFHAAGEFSEPIMYRNLFIDYLRSCRQAEDDPDGDVLEITIPEGVEKIGITVTAMPPAPEPILVKSLRSGCWAEWAGVAAGQEILQLNGVSPKTMTEQKFKDAFATRPLTLRLKQPSSGKERGKSKYRKWLERNCVSVARMNQFIALVSELAVKFTWAVPSAADDPKIMLLASLKQKKSSLSEVEIQDLFRSNTDRIKFALTGAFSPSFVQGEINLANRNEAKIRGSGLDPMKTCLLANITPKELRDPELLMEFVQKLAPAKTLKFDSTGATAFIECGPDPNLGPQTVHQMPLLAQLLHQLMRLPCKFEPLTRRGIQHDSAKIGSPNFLNGMKWHVNGMRTFGTPYWRSNMGFMCEMRTELRCHWGVCSSLLGREGPDKVRISGLTILPPPGTAIGTMMILAYLSGPFRVTLLGPENAWHGVEIVATDAANLRPMVLSFAPGVLSRAEVEVLNSFRAAQSAVLAQPSLCQAAVAGRAFAKLLDAVDKMRAAKCNNWIPAADHDITTAGDVLTLLPMVRDAGSGPGEWERYELAGARSISFLRPVQMAYPEVKEISGVFRIRMLPPWLRRLAEPARQDLLSDLKDLKKKFHLGTAVLGKVPPSTHFVEVTASARASVEACRAELIDGILMFYRSIAEWSAAEASEVQEKKQGEEVKASKDEVSTGDAPEEPVTKAEEAANTATESPEQKQSDDLGIDFDQLLEMNTDFAEVLQDSGSIDVYRQAWQEDPHEWLKQVRDQGFSIVTKRPSKMVLPRLLPRIGKKAQSDEPATKSDDSTVALREDEPASKAEDTGKKAQSDEPSTKSEDSTVALEDDKVASTAEDGQDVTREERTRVTLAEPDDKSARETPASVSSDDTVSQNRTAAKSPSQSDEELGQVEAAKAYESPVKFSLRSQGMPAYEAKDRILDAIRKNRVVVISGDTGCGKSTVIPQLICDASDLVPANKLVICTEPRRVAAITLGEYVSKDRGQSLADEVGYQIRFVNEFTARTRLVFATTAIILRRLHREPDLDSVGCLIIDEVHERDVYTDFLLLLVKAAMQEGRMQHLKVVVMSATLKADELAEYFEGVNTGLDGARLPLNPLHVPGRMFNVEVKFLEDAISWTDWKPSRRSKGRDEDKERSQKRVRRKLAESEAEDPASERLVEAIAAWEPGTVYLDLIQSLILLFHKRMGQEAGAILVFLPGWGDISKLFLSLMKVRANFNVITLHSMMTPEQQLEAFERPPAGTRKIILATNIAETSVTIDDVVYVIDSGVRKERTYNPATRIGTLETLMVTKANAVQRRGRAGRTAEGTCVHLFPSWEFESLEEFPIPQMLTSSMEEVVLQSKMICPDSKNDQISKMLTTSMAAPKQEAVDDAVNRLKLIGCLTRRHSVLTPLGRAVAQIPIQPPVAKMLLMAGALRCLKPMAGIAAFLSHKNPFQQQADQKSDGKKMFDKGFQSDHILSLQAYCEWQQSKRKAGGHEFCMDFGLSPEVLDLAEMMVGQLTTFVLDMGYDGNDVRSGNLAEVDPLIIGSEVDALVRAAIVAGCSPSICALFRSNPPRRNPPFPRWVSSSASTVSPFRGSSNFECPEPESDGDSWMAFSDSMRIGNLNSIMDSTMVTTSAVLLFANALHVDFEACRIRFDSWTAIFDPWDGERLQDLLELRKELFPAFAKALEAKNLSLFPRSLVARITAYVMQPSFKLENLQTMYADVLTMGEVPIQEVSTWAEVDEE
eukprot:TRINITY_DN20352_c0_g1_i1.p1 TRINITY_DN20352_c0_g1~~TRINITY_DN20352_c0_g1_i1.p1  ORF type:complete len:2384 (-),score=428.36 TRINITY_DN20352_c0_g1_i1:36-7187(-)